MRRRRRRRRQQRLRRRWTPGCGDRGAGRADRGGARLRSQELGPMACRAARRRCARHLARLGLQQRGDRRARGDHVSAGPRDRRLLVPQRLRRRRRLSGRLRRLGGSRRRPSLVRRGDPARARASAGTTRGAHVRRERGRPVPSRLPRCGGLRGAGSCRRPRRPRRRRRIRNRAGQHRWRGTGECGVRLPRPCALPAESDHSRRGDL